MIFLMTALLTGCQDPKKEEESKNEDTILNQELTVVGVSQLGSESMWRSANTVSIKETFCKENGYFLLFDNARQKQENQIKAIRSFISQRVDYIVFSPITEEGWETVLQEAKDAGIPVILMDRNVKVADESLYTTWVGSDFTEEGRKAGEWLAEHLAGIKFNDEDVNIVVLQGTKGSSAMLGRSAGFHEVASQYPNWKILEEVNGDFTTVKGKEEMAQLLKKHENIDVLVSQNDDMTFGALEAIREAEKETGVKRDIIIISFDATRTALEKVKAGTINADVECNPLLGDEIEEVIQRIENDAPVEKAYYIEEKVFTQKNVMSVIKDRIY
ncbi:MAG: ABC transporter substrate-binding protein [Faecalicatena sp.]|nr:ABC transporter substrate-binding protein [Faecalicatena sp.]MCI6464241.1 ABC transporter substrate-binding protein [Faecalicatena sp.]MDY5621208.1 ABC transporter substrate-binding protein [Lachnospiraceae bacterium]